MLVMFTYSVSVTMLLLELNPFQYLRVDRPILA